MGNMRGAAQQALKTIEAELEEVATLRERVNSYVKTIEGLAEDVTKVSLKNVEVQKDLERAVGALVYCRGVLARATMSDPGMDKHYNFVLKLLAELEGKDYDQPAVNPPPRGGRDHSHQHLQQG